MDELDFKLLEVLNQTNNLTRASDILNMTQSAISKRIKAMEAEFNTPLFIRSHNGVRFTTAGEKFHFHCQKITHELTQLHSFLKDKEQTVYGSLTVGISDNFMTYHLPAIADSYVKKYPNVSLRFRTEKSHVLYPLLLNNQVDLAIIRGNYGWDGIKELLSTEAMCIVLNNDLKDRTLETIPYIDRTTDSFQYALMTKWRRENGLLGNNRIITMDSIASTMEMVKRSAGWALIPEIALENFNGIIKPCYFQNGELFTRQTHLYCRQEVSDQPPVKAFINEIRSNEIRYKYGG